MERCDGALPGTKRLGHRSERQKRGRLRLAASLSRLDSIAGREAAAGTGVSLTTAKEDSTVEAEAAAGAGAGM
jgi:hypothetical protein